MGAVVMPVLAFLSLVWIDWRMAIAMFAALPVALLVLWMSTSVQKKLSGKADTSQNQCRKPLEEYLQGIRVMKATTCWATAFVRLRDAFCGTAPRLHPSGSPAGSLSCCCALHWCGPG